MDFAQIVVDQWKHYEAVDEFHLDAYCVIPDHYHTVLKVWSFLLTFNST